MIANQENYAPSWRKYVTADDFNDDDTEEGDSEDDEPVIMPGLITALAN